MHKKTRSIEISSLNIVGKLQPIFVMNFLGNEFPSSWRKTPLRIVYVSLRMFGYLIRISKIYEIERMLGNAAIKCTMNYHRKGLHPQRTSSASHYSNSQTENLLGSILSFSLISINFSLLQKCLATLERFCSNLLRRSSSMRRTMSSTPIASR
jgi:hypothetical protein